MNNGGVWKVSTLCTRRLGVKHSNQNQETHQRTQRKMHWEAFVGVVVNVFGLLDHVGVWCSEKVLNGCM